MICLMSRTTYTFSSFRVGLKLCRKSEGLAYENAENRYPPRTIRPKIDPRAYVRLTHKAQRKPCKGSYSFTCILAFITGPDLPFPFQPKLVIVCRPRRDERLSWPTWLVTSQDKCPAPGTEPDTITHPTINRARRRLTSLIETNALPLCQTTTDYRDIASRRNTCMC